MTEVEGVWLPLYHEFIWHLFVMEDGHLRALCGHWKGPGGTSTTHRRRKQCPECKRILESGSV